MTDNTSSTETQTCTFCHGPDHGGLDYLCRECTCTLTAVDELTSSFYYLPNAPQVGWDKHCPVHRGITPKLRTEALQDFREQMIQQLRATHRMLLETLEELPEFNFVQSMTDSRGEYEEFKRSCALRLFVDLLRECAVDDPDSILDATNRESVWNAVIALILTDFDRDLLPAAFLSAFGVETNRPEN